MCFACGVREGRRQHDQIQRLSGTQCAEEFWKAQVIADAEPDPPRFSVAIGECEGYRFMPGTQANRLVITANAVVKFEQVDLVVTSDPLPLRVVSQHRVVDLVRVVAGDGNRAADEPNPMCLRRRGQHVLDGCACRVRDGRIGQGFCDGQLVGVAVSHEAEILWQCNQLCTRLGRLRDPCTCVIQVVSDARRRDHLECGDFHCKGTGAVTGAFSKTTSTLMRDLTMAPFFCPGV